MQSTNPNGGNSEISSAAAQAQTSFGTEDRISPESICEGDVILLSGALEGHDDAAALAKQSPAGHQSPTFADAAHRLRQAGVELHCLNALGQDGLARRLVEVAQQACISMDVDEGAIPVAPGTRDACERRHRDPLFLASEGRFVVFVPHADTDRALDVLRSLDGSPDARTIGSVWAIERSEVCLAMASGATRDLESEVASANLS